MHMNCDARKGDEPCTPHTVQVTSNLTSSGTRSVFSYFPLPMQASTLESHMVEKEGPKVFSIGIITSYTLASNPKQYEDTRVVNSSRMDAHLCE